MTNVNGAKCPIVLTIRSVTKYYKAIFFYKLIIKCDPFENALLVPFYYPQGPTTIVCHK